MLADVSSQASTLTDDLMPFLHANGRTFRRRPELPSHPDKVSVTTTCTCLMSLVMANKLGTLYGKDFHRKTQECFRLVATAPWKSSGLSRDNPFTISLVLRTLGFLLEAGIFDHTFASETIHANTHAKLESFTIIAQRLANRAPNSFQIQRGRLPSLTVAYWYVDGVDRSRIPISSKGWKRIFDWADNAFIQSVMKVKAGDVSTMDPVEMAMAASLLAKLRAMATHSHSGTSPELLVGLKSHVAFQEALDLLFAHQDPSGLWHKYFELFSYRDESGSNYCFSFEMLEALLHEFGASHLELQGVTFDRLNSAFQWSIQHRKQHEYEGTVYRGWNSAGQPEPLSKGIPESWATAVVHMFLQELHENLTNQLQRITLTKYFARIVSPRAGDWDHLLSMPIRLPGNVYETTNDLLLNEVALPVERLTPSSIRKTPLRRARFVLLFGPPGTGKTELVRAFARKIDWPLVELSPSNFLTESLDAVFQKSEEVFLDLSDLAGTVIFFDEIDGFVRERDGPETDTVSRMLTTTMLPKLGNLRERGHVIFFAATNHREKADTAIKRFGRFDVQICVTPPVWREKVAKIDRFVEDLPPGEQAIVVQQFNALTADVSAIQKQILDLLTFGETRAFFRSLAARGLTFAESIARLSLPVFAARIDELGRQMTLAEGSESYDEFVRDRDMSKLS